MTDDARELVSAAQTLLRPPTGTMGSLTPVARARAAAMLLRLALEQRLDTFWRGVAPGMTRIEKHRILCLEAYTDRGTARRWYLTWSALSAACHHRTHELPPSLTEIHGRLLEVNILLDAVPGGGSAATATAVIPPPQSPPGRTTAPSTPHAVPSGEVRRAGRPVPMPGPTPGRRVVPPVVGGP
ncbi:hypothetical protein [Streptomyces sp. NBC_01506]|uniref:hypothetical protein n=1 Tax=Streptomyces sp. NBC_01506 TaxID=2903887 RepID=UPI00386A80F4